MAGIQDYLNQIKNAIYGKDVRQAIHDGIQQCYYDGKAGATDLEARQRLDSAEGSISSLGSRMSTAETDIDVLDSRVDQIVAPSGEAPSAAEVSDARVGADGKTYSSLGNANRTQFSDLKDQATQALNGVIKSGNSLFNLETVNTSSYELANTMYRINGGVLETLSNTDYQTVLLPCNPYDTYYVDSTVGKADVLYLAIFLDTNQNLISGYEQGNSSSRTNYANKKIIAPSGCKYIAFTCYKYMPTVKTFGNHSVVSDLKDDIIGINNKLYFKEAVDTDDYLEENVFYRISSDGVFEKVSNSAYDSIVMPCNEGEVYFVNSTVGAANVLYLAIFLNDNQKLISGYKQGGASPITYMGEMIVIPKGCSYVAISSFNRTPSISTWGDNTIVEEIDNDVSHISDLLFAKDVIDTSAYLQENKYYRIYEGSLQVVTHVDYDTVVMPCNAGDVYYVTSKVANADVLYLAIFLDANQNLISGYKQGNNSTSTLYTNERVDIPAGCSYVAFTSRDILPVVSQANYNKTDIVSDSEKFTPSSKGTYFKERNGMLRDRLMGTYSKLIDGTLKWTVLGDSITDTWDGHNHSSGGASDAAHGYAKIVQRWLRTKYGNGILFTNNGTGGITTYQSIAKVSQYLQGQNFDLIVVALGTNDWNTQRSLSDFETDYNALLDEIADRTDAEVAMVGLGYFGEWQPSKLIREDKYNEVLMKIARERGIPFVCPYYEMANAIENGGYPFASITYTSDPVHPNDIGHRIWADTTYKLFDIL